MSTDDSTTDPPPTNPPPLDTSRRRVWPLVALFLVGLLLGGVVVAVAGLGGTTKGNFSDGTRSSLSAEPATTSPTRPTAAPSGNDGARVLVDATCLQALNQAQALYDAATGIGDAARNLDAGRLDAIVRRLAVVEPQLRRSLADCHATVQLPSTSASPVPLPTTSGTGGASSPGAQA